MLRLIARHGVTHMHIVPTMFVRLLRLPAEMRARYDVSSLRFVSHGAAPCAPAVKRQMIEWWGPVINEYYGATETGVVVWHGSEDALRKPGTVGRAVPGATVRVVDEQGRDVPTGEVAGRTWRISPTTTTTPSGERWRSANSSPSATSATWIPTASCSCATASAT